MTLRSSSRTPAASGGRSSAVHAEDAERAAREVDTVCSSSRQRREEPDDSRAVAEAVFRGRFLRAQQGRSRRPKSRCCDIDRGAAPKRLRDPAISAASRHECDRLLTLLRRPPEHPASSRRWQRANSRRPSTWPRSSRAHLHLTHQEVRTLWRPRGRPGGARASQRSTSVRRSSSSRTPEGEPDRQGVPCKRIGTDARRELEASRYPGVSGTDVDVPPELAPGPAGLGVRFQADV